MKNIARAGHLAIFKKKKLFSTQTEVSLFCLEHATFPSPKTTIPPYHKTFGCKDSFVIS